MKSLTLLVLRCRDLEACRRLYESLGLRFSKHAHGTGPEHCAHVDERGIFELYPAAGDAAGDGVGDKTGLGFGFSDLDEVFGALVASATGPSRRGRTRGGARSS